MEKVENIEREGQGTHDISLLFYFFDASLSFDLPCPICLLGFPSSTLLTLAPNRSVDTLSFTD
jgi:hypothetical protein